MPARIGKIARLPHAIREQLNQRLHNGELSPKLLPWLNQLPQVKQVLNEHFDGAAINRQNLSEWRLGGYQDWLRHQHRELRIRRLTEETTDLRRHEGNEDLFEGSARIALAELMTDMDTLHELRGEERRKRLHSLIHDLARLQNEYNRSRWTELVWVKWNDRFLGPKDYKFDPPLENKSSNPLRTTSSSNQKPIASSPTVREPASVLPSPLIPLTSPEPPDKPRQAPSTGDDHPGSAALPPNPIIPHAPAGAENQTVDQHETTTPEPTTSSPTPVHPSSPASPPPQPTPSPQILKIDPVDDFLRQAAYRRRAIQ